MWVALAWKSFVVLGLAWVAAMALRKRAAALRHLVWAAAFAALLVLPVLSSLLPALLVPREATPEGLLASVTTTTGSSGAAVLSQQVRMAATGAPSGPSSFDVNPVELAGWLWGAGTLVSLLRLAVACFAALRLRSQSKPVAGLNSDGLAGLLGIKGTVNVLSVPAGEMPTSFGNTVFIPADAVAWNADRQRAVLLHELAHVRRGDTGVQIVARLGLSLYWWNPLAWIAWRGLLNEREHAADDLVLQAGMRATDYAGHLVEVARALQPRQLMTPAVVAMARQSGLEGRLMSILDSGRDRHVPSPWVGLCVVTAALLLAAPVAALRAQGPDSELPADIEGLIRAAVLQKNAEVLESTAARAAEMLKYDAAAKLMRSALEVRAQVSGDRSKEYGTSLLKMAQLEQRSGKAAEAQQTYTKAAGLLENLPESAPAVIQLALSELAVKNYDRASAMLERAVLLNPADAARAKMWIGVVRERQGRPADAELMYRDALGVAKAESDDAATILEVHSQMLKAQGRTEDAAVLNDRALGLRKARGAQTSPSRTASTGAYKVGGDVKAPSVVSKVEPLYSEEARLARYQGSAVIQLEVGPDGVARNMRVLRGLGLGLSEKALEAIAQWQFKPGTKGGEPVPVVAMIEVNFRLL